MYFYQYQVFVVFTMIIILDKLGGFMHKCVVELLLPKHDKYEQGKIRKILKINIMSLYTLTMHF